MHAGHWIRSDFIVLTTIGTEASILEIALRTNSAMRIDAYIHLSMAITLHRKSASGA